MWEGRTLELNMNAQRILVVEDDHVMGPMIVTGLLKARYQAILAADIDRALSLLAEPFSLIVLDLSLPDGSGFEILQSLRHRSILPVLVLTARQDLQTRVRSFELGAADWMAKPFYMEELIARIRARLPSATDPANARCVRLGELELHLDARRALLRGDELRLTPIEFNILTYLLEREERVISRQILMDATLPLGEPRAERTIDSHVAHLRRKLGDLGAHISTVWGIGYRFSLKKAA